MGVCEDLLRTIAKRERRELLGCRQIAEDAIARISKLLRMYNPGDRALSSLQKLEGGLDAQLPMIPVVLRSVRLG